MREVLQVGEHVTRAAQGIYVFIRQADGPVYITVLMQDGRQSGHELDHRQQVELVGEIRELKIQNLHGALNTVVIDTGYGRFHPRQDGQEMTIVGQSDPLTVGNDDQHPLHVINEYEQTVVTDPAQPLDVKHQPPAGQVNALPEIVPDVTGAVVPASAGRRALLLRAAPDNTGLIWLSGAAGVGLPLAATDGPLKLETTAAVELLAANATDKVFVMELIA